MQRYITKKHFVVTVFQADSLSETDHCIATRQYKMMAPDVVSAHFKKLNVVGFFCPWMVHCAEMTIEHKTNR